MFASRRACAIRGKTKNADLSSPQPQAVMPEPEPDFTSIVLRRSLGAGMAGTLHLLDAVAWEEDGGLTAFRAFFASGTPLEAFATEPPTDCASISEIREVSGGIMLAGRQAAPGPLRLALAEGALEVAAAHAETGIFVGLNTIFAQRFAEAPETVVEWLVYHAAHHGLRGAVILNRAKTGQAAFARAVERLLAEFGAGLRVVILDSPVPLGDPGLGPETHPFLAPDAPGKDRMEQPARDPWLSPLGQALIYEIVKWRFLAKARAVLTLDVADILTPGQDRNAFDLCRAAKDGVVLLVGRRIYPWRVREGQRARFADHICRQFDARRGIARWGTAPDIAGLDRTWRGIRVAFARPDPGQTVPFWRAMALKVPGQSASVLAPKTSLVEDPALLDLSREVFAHKPIRPPVSKPREAPAHAARAGRTCIVTTMKNEGPFILEWLAYHRAIGVEDFLIYTNDCTDGTDTMLALLDEKGFVQHRENPFRGTALKPQHAALQAAESEPVLQDCGWAICMDVDEFITVKIGDGTLPALYHAMGEANMIALTWRLFGNADVHRYEDRFVTEQFSLCAPELIRKPHQAWGFKTLFRNIDIYKKLGVHRPKGLKPDLWDQVKWLNGSGQPMPRQMFRNGWRSTPETYGYDWVSLNHYAVRSAESFMVKRDRGRVNHIDRDQGLNYWFRMNHNAVEDLAIRRMLPKARAEFDRLLADPDIRAAHEASVAAHRAKIAELHERPDYEALFRELTGERFERLSRMLHIFGAAVFNAGPDSVPPDLHRRELPKDFFFTVAHDGEARH